MVVVVPELGDRLFAPNNLRCKTCNELIADHLVYAVDGEPYCARHWSEHPTTAGLRCYGCDEMIVAGKYVQAEDLSYHLEHFCCNSCDMQLGGHQYVRPNMCGIGSDDKNPYCQPCYVEN